MEAVDMGGSSVEAQPVQAPADEKICEVQVTTKAEDLTPSQIKIRTRHDAGGRVIIVNETNCSPEAVAEHWANFEAMKATAEGAKFFAGLGAELKKHPLVVKASVVQPVAEPEEPVVEPE